MPHFLPSTERLYAALQADLPAPEAQDVYPIHAAMVAWENALFYTLSEEGYRSGKWPAPPALLAAMRAALADQRGNYAGDHLAYCLVRCGCRETETLASLCAWDAQLFHWHDAGLRAAGLLARFDAIGCAGAPANADLLTFDGWLSDPAAALSGYGWNSLHQTILQGRTFACALHADGDDPQYAALFELMAQHAALPVTNVKVVALDDILGPVTDALRAHVAGRTPEAFRDTLAFMDREHFWELSFDLDGSTETVVVPGDFAWLNDAALAMHVDAILARLGRLERVLRFGGGRSDSESFQGHYIVAPPQEFAALCGGLGIPLKDFTGSLLG